jgi:hypothetical protein
VAGLGGADLARGHGPGDVQHPAVAVLEAQDGELAPAGAGVGREADQ